MEDYKLFSKDGIWEDWDSGDTVFSGEFEGERWIADICKECKKISGFHKDKLNHWIKGNCQCEIPCWNNGHTHDHSDKIEGFCLRLQEFINRMEKEQKEKGIFEFASGGLVL